MSAMKKSFAAGAAVVALLAACGDDVTNVTEVNGKASLDIVEKYKELPKCEESVYGSLVYVEDSLQVYACTPSGWSSLKGEKGDKGDDGATGKNGKNGEDGKDGKDGKDGSSCTATALEDGSGIEVKCDGKVVGTIKNGTDGAKGADGTNGTNGKNGEDGKDGESCTTKPVENGIEVSCPGAEPVVITNGDKGEDGKSAYELSGTDKTLEEWLASLKGDNGESCTATALQDGSGMEVKCGGKTVGTIKNGTNGTDGEDGTDGENGTSCDIVSDEGGVVTIQCGEGENAKTTKLYKAMCGADPFDPADKFCFKENLYDLCNGEKYDPETLFCAKFNDDAKTEQLYKMVTIAPEGTDYSETWMAENLNYKTENSWCGGGSEATEGDCSVYGRLYTWAAAFGKTEEECGNGGKCNPGDGNVQGVCPEGWHLPSRDEWEKLIVAVDDNITEYTDKNVAGQFLRSKTGGKEPGNIINEDAFGFSALPAGYKEDGRYRYEGYAAYIWSSSENNGYSAHYIYLHFKYEVTYLATCAKYYGFSVRCLKDSP